MADILHHNTLLRSLRLSLVLQSPSVVSRHSEGIQINQSLRALNICMFQERVIPVSNAISITPLLQSLRDNSCLLHLDYNGQPLDSADMKLVASVLALPSCHLLSIDIPFRIGTHHHLITHSTSTPLTIRF